MVGVAAVAMTDTTAVGGITMCAKKAMEKRRKKSEISGYTNGVALACVKCEMTDRIPLLIYHAVFDRSVPEDMVE